MISLPDQRLQQLRDTQRQTNERHMQQQRGTQRQQQTRGAQRDAENEPPATQRREPRKPAREEDALFSELLEEGERPGLPQTFNQPDSQQQGFSQLDESSTAGAPPAMAMWQEVETDLLAATEQRQPGEMTLTFILPKLGHVDARFSALAAGGWDIALKLQPSAWRALLPHQERCRLSLRQRMACRVRLRFERRAAEPEA
ncbi:type III secretion system HrpP C-terminal domain-containing protein [Kalamiella sp. sgz302252]|uniref:type III secretion system HrpP C-terminal domain-containing protein n=1 Tax=Pantoea sp. sgz302252 TaxID=3341827 RepID=UPI0036D3A7EE